MDNMISHEKITKSEFNELLDQYHSLIESIDKSKPAKEGQKSLQDLDRLRFVDAPDRFAGETPMQEMKHDDLKSLVEWKLRHGKYRPTLMSLISSNPPDLTSRTIQSALQSYRSAKDIGLALDTLTQLKGVGPATASLLLAVHDPSNVIFFSDEAFHWLCNRGPPIKYNLSEYLELCEEAKSLAERLGVSALEIEKVAHVLVKQQQQGKIGKSEPPSKKYHIHPSSTPLSGRKGEGEPPSKKYHIHPSSTPISDRKHKYISSMSGEDIAEKEFKKRKETNGDKTEVEKSNGPPLRRSQRLRK